MVSTIKVPMMDSEKDQDNFLRYYENIRKVSFKLKYS